MDPSDAAMTMTMTMTMTGWQLLTLHQNQKSVKQNLTLYFKMIFSLQDKERGAYKRTIIKYD